MPLDVLGRTVRTLLFALPLSHHFLPLYSLFQFASSKKHLLTVFLARYTDRDNEFITLAGRSG